MIFAPCDRQAQGHITTSFLTHLPRTLNLKAKLWESTSQTSGLPVNELNQKTEAEDLLIIRWRL